MRRPVVDEREAPGPVAHGPDIAIVDEARKRLGLSFSDLWLSYFALGGKADRLEFEAIFQGLMRPDTFEYNLLIQALNEHFMDRGEEERLPYLDDTSDKGSRPGE